MKEDTEFQLPIQTSVDSQTMLWAKKTSRAFAKLMSYYRCAMLEMETRFNVLNEEYLLEYGRSPINTVKSRLKTLPSLQEKVKRRNIIFSLEEIEAEIHDIAGVRVICAFPEDVYTVADALLKQDDILLIKQKDYIANPKPNGYRSLHLIVAVPVYLSSGKRMTKVEIQIRTIAMDFWASLEHQLRYKQDTVFTDEMAQELYECAQLSAALDTRMDNLRKSVIDHHYQGTTEEAIERNICVLCAVGFTTKKSEIRKTVLLPERYFSIFRISMIASSAMRISHAFIRVWKITILITHKAKGTGAIKLRCHCI